VCGLLRKALADEKLNIKVSALVNDTPGTMLAGGYSDPSVCAGLILGTGTNACYLEKVSKAPKLQVCRAQPQSFCTLKKHTKQMLFDFNRCRDGVRRGSEREECRDWRDCKSLICHQILTIYRCVCAAFLPDTEGGQQSSLCGDLEPASSPARWLQHPHHQHGMG